MAELITTYDTDVILADQGYDDHFHEHHHGDKYQTGFIHHYIFSMDHKIIARQFLITGIFWAIIGAAMSVIFRLQLGFPEESMAWIKPLLGKWIVLDEAGIGTLAPEFYYALVTMHGTILVFFVLTAGLSGTFSNLLIPLQIGARDMASPFLNMLSYWFFFTAGVIMFYSLFLSTGPFSGGWTAYPPLSALPQASTGSGTGMTLWLVSLTLFFFVTAILGLLSFPVLASGFFMLIMDRSLGTSFFLSDIFIEGAALDRVGGTPILYQHLFWFLGHPEVYIIILPAMGIASEVLSVHARKPIFGYKAMVLSILAIGFLSFIVWAHHMFMSGVNPFISNFFVIFTLIIAVPSAVKVFNWITTLWGGNIRLNSAMLFAIGFVSMFISGGLTGIFLGNSAIDIQLHDTYFVVAHFHIVMGIAAFFGMFAGIRRYYSFDGFDAFRHFGDLNKFITIAAAIVFMLQLLFVLNFFYSIWKGKKMTTRNPWEATTLEWSTPIEGIHGNWPGKIPSVHRWAYDYNKDEREYVPQYIPMVEGEEAGDH